MTSLWITIWSYLFSISHAIVRSNNISIAHTSIATETKKHKRNRTKYGILSESYIIWHYQLIKMKSTIAICFHSHSPFAICRLPFGMWDSFMQHFTKPYIIINWFSWFWYYCNWWKSLPIVIIGIKNNIQYASYIHQLCASECLFIFQALGALSTLVQKA